MKLAMENIQGEHFFLNAETLTLGLEQSRQSERKRMILPIHRSKDALVQRMLNFLQPGTYIRPHMHPEAFASETFLLMQGSLHFILFDQRGEIVAVRFIEAQKPQCLVDIEPKLWHSFVVLEEDTVVLEIKRGPYNANGDKIFPEWAPEEFSREAVHYMQQLEKKIEKVV
ncbi:MAG: WbuC family cupin fold metalloprotein [Verrucomicrobiota bacterium]